MDSGIVIGLIGAAGSVLATAITALWRRISTELDDCKKDRQDLWQASNTTSERIVKLSEEVGELRGKLSQDPTT